MSAALAIVIAAFAAPAQDRPPEDPSPPALVIVPRISVFFADVRGRIRADEGTFPSPILDGSSIRMASDLELDDSDPIGIFEIAAFHRAEGRHVGLGSISYLQASYEGTSTFNSTETFNGRTFSAGATVRSEYRYRSFGADFAVVDAWPGLIEDASGAVIVGARYTDLRVSLEGGGGETDERIRLFWIGAGFRGESRVGPFSAVLQAAGYVSVGNRGGWYDFRYEEWGGFLFEGTAAVTGTFGPAHLEAGWRLISSSAYATVDDGENFEDNDFSFQLGGPYLSATLRF